MKDSKPASKMPLVDKKLTAKEREAQLALETYLKKYKLDPTKDWSKDKKHGSKIKELTSALNVARKKIQEAAPAEIHHKKSDDKNKPDGKGGKEKASYDYPKVDGKEMSSLEKKRYRQKMRSGKTPAEALSFAKAAVEVKSTEKDDKKVAVVAKPSVKTSSTKTETKPADKVVGKTGKKKLKVKSRTSKED